MRSPASAIAWEFGRRHRWGLMAVAGYLFVLAMVRLFFIEPGQDLKLEDAQTFALFVVLPLAATFMYFLAVFSFGLAGDVAARQSVYPARMFALPVTTNALAGWPMLYGAVAMAILWLAMRLFGLWPSDAHVPMFWPALLGPVLLAWTQALTWMPYPLPGLRVIVTVVWLSAIDVVVMVALEAQASEGVMLAILAPHIPLAYLVARFAVARARRDEVPDWRRMAVWIGRLADVLPRGRDHFPSPSRAQVWFEWRQHGRSLPWLVAMVVPFELALLFPFRETPVIVFEVLCGVLLTPPFLATFVAATVGKWTADEHGVPPFIATRPLTNASLIAAKLQATIWSTAAAWLLILAVVPLALRLSDTTTVVIDAARRTTELFGMPRATALLSLAFAALIVSTWKQLVQSLYIGMSGREWIAKASVFVALSLLAVVVPIAHWILSSKALTARFLWDVLPWLAAALVCIKLSAAAWIAIRLYDRRLLGDGTLIAAAACWAASVFVLYGVLKWIFPAMLVRGSFITLVAILGIPLARLAATPLALEWSRHR